MTDLLLPLPTHIVVLTTGVNEGLMGYPLHLHAVGRLRSEICAFLTDQESEVVLSISLGNWYFTARWMLVMMYIVFIIF
jgi:hypothetical protein